LTEQESAAFLRGMEHAARICESRADRYQRTPIHAARDKQAAAQSCAFYIRKEAKKVLMEPLQSRD
jgi:hypothetical protein